MTLQATRADNEHIPCVVLWNGKADGAIGGGISFAVTGDHDNRPTDMTNLVVISNENNMGNNKYEEQSNNNERCCSDPYR